VGSFDLKTRAENLVTVSLSRMFKLSSQNYSELPGEASKSSQFIGWSSSDLLLFILPLKAADITLLKWRKGGPASLFISDWMAASILSSDFVTKMFI
jgi:hypothetical protein